MNQKEKQENWEKEFVEIADTQRFSADQRDIFYSFIARLLKKQKDNQEIKDTLHYIKEAVAEIRSEIKK